MIPEAAVEAATQAIIDAAYGQELPEAAEDLARAALEAAAPHMLGYQWPLGDDDNPHRDGDVQPSSHWIVNRDTDWGCDGCDWTGATLQDYWDAHGKPGEYKIPF